VALAAVDTGGAGVLATTLPVLAGATTVVVTTGLAVVATGLAAVVAAGLAVVVLAAGAIVAPLVAAPQVASEPGFRHSTQAPAAHCFMLKLGRRGGLVIVQSAFFEFMHCSEE
jgi:hypothetical protein